MSVSGVAANTPATGTEATAGTRTRLAENFDTFLTLLTSQLRNQDPLSPMDSTQFTQQMVQMTGVEQQLLTNDLLNKLVANSNSGISTAVSLIGKDVRAVTDTTALKGGKSEWFYELDREAAEVKFEVIDANGKTVASKTVTGGDDIAAGEHKFAWDGKDITGRALPDGGQYKLRVTTKDTTGAAVPVSIYIQGLVAGVEQADGQTMLTINGAKVPWGQVASIYEPKPATPPPTGSGGSTQTASDDESGDTLINPAG
ncbi:flagellar hook assembly protein FlgD [Phenylobacterium sp.]|jgi:flagellar basal-body rod modification protein FlgD|uniref:flagellar hook assembly protein FlgD n=1 Tax=Phenylobacterium sp. TaxID=1871053 RepID=UPI002F951335